MPIDRQRFDRIFSPKTVVVVGAKKATNYSWLRNMLTVKGKLYSVQLDENEIPGIEDLGVTNYKSMAEVPEPIDYVLVAVPRNVTPIILADAIKANAGGGRDVHLRLRGDGRRRPRPPGEGARDGPRGRHAADRAQLHGHL